MSHYTRPGILTALLLLPALAAPAGRADWQRIETRSVQQTTLNTTLELGFRRDDLQAVNGVAVQADRSLLSGGRLDPSTGFSPVVEGGVFSLNITNQPADPAAAASFSATDAAAASSLTLRRGANGLSGTIDSDGTLRAGPGDNASRVELTVTQTYSVF